MGVEKGRVDQYSPGGEWSRWYRNRSIGFGWKYTVGLLSSTLYTLLPGRIFGGDNYNPYSNTINVYSDVPAIALHEGGHAKDFAPRKYKGTYGVFLGLPILNLRSEARATGDVLGYLKRYECTEQEKQAYEILYPAYATYIGGNTRDLFLPYEWVYYAAVIPGHIIGRTRGQNVASRRMRDAR